MAGINFSDTIPWISVKRALIVVYLMVALAGPLFAQADRKFIRQGNRNYAKENYTGSEILYRRAADKNKSSADAVFNTGDALYKQKKYIEAGEKFTENVSLNEDGIKKSAAWYNLGNSLLLGNKTEESIEAYKNALRLNPGSMEAKHNLARAQDLLRQQQEQQEKQDKQDKQDQQENNENENRDQQQQPEKDNRQNQGQDEKDEQQQQQQQQQQISPEDAQRLLDAIANDEKKVQEKVQQEKAARERVRTEKNW